MCHILWYCQIQISLSESYLLRIPISLCVSLIAVSLAKPSPTSDCPMCCISFYPKIHIPLSEPYLLTILISSCISFIAVSPAMPSPTSNILAQMPTAAVSGSPTTQQQQYHPIAKQAIGRPSSMPCRPPPLATCRLPLAGCHLLPAACCLCHATACCLPCSVIQHLSNSAYCKLFDACCRRLCVPFCCPTPAGCFQRPLPLDAWSVNRSTPSATHCHNLKK